MSPSSISGGFEVAEEIAMQSKARHKRPRTGLKILLCLLPALAIYTYVVVVPILRAINLSMYKWSGGPHKVFAGWKNYSILMRDTTFWNAFRNNIWITILCIIGQIGIAFIFSCLLNSRFIKMKSFHRCVSFFPSTVSAVVVGFVWMFMFNYNHGLINSILRAVGLGKYASAWLDNPNTIIRVVSIPLIWQYIGYYMVIILAAMTSVDKSIYEVAELDGASGWQRAIHITLPMIKDSLIVAVMLCISGNMKIFDHIYVMTNGGPGTSSMVMALDIYKTTFIKNQFGYACAMSVMAMILSIAIVSVIRLLAAHPWKKGDV